MWRAQADPDLSIQYASIAAPITPATQEVPLFVVLLQPLAATPDEVDGLALGGPVHPRFLPAPGGPRITAKALKRNSGGHKR